MVSLWLYDKEMKGPRRGGQRDRLDPFRNPTRHQTVVERVLVVAGREDITLALNGAQQDQIDMARHGNAFRLIVVTGGQDVIGVEDAGIAEHRRGKNSVARAIEDLRPPMDLGKDEALAVSQPIGIVQDGRNISDVARP